MNFKLPGFWDEIANLIGKDLTQTIYNYFQTIEIALIIAAIIAGALVILGMSVRVWFSDNEDAKKHLKLARSRAFHTIGYIFLGLIFIEVFWQ
jgi:hypothetical protein